MLARSLQIMVDRIWRRRKSRQQSTSNPIGHDKQSQHQNPQAEDYDPFQDPSTKMTVYTDGSNIFIDKDELVRNPRAIKQVRELNAFVDRQIARRKKG